MFVRWIIFAFCYTYFSFLLLLSFVLLLFLASTASKCWGSLLSLVVVCCCWFLDFSFFPPSPDTFHLNMLTCVLMFARCHYSVILSLPHLDTTNINHWVRGCWEEKSNYSYVWSTKADTWQLVSITAGIGESHRVMLTHRSSTDNWVVRSLRRYGRGA